jgi:hypothetical protein
VDVINWRKSSRSGGNGGECVEVGQVPGIVAVRDTKDDRTGPVLGFAPGAWERFTEALKDR